jgi:23S rRNA (uracil1939-C5)-methyltransferase
MLRGVSQVVRIDATITSVAPGGDGVAHVELRGERRAVFVPHTAPGDVIRAEADVSSRPARGKLLEVVTPSPDRVTPACPWSLRCGGCDWMHLSASAQEHGHIDHVRAALPAAWRTLPITSHAAPEMLEHRTRARLHIRGSRGKVTVGMHEARTHDPVEVDTCAVLEPTLELGRRSVGPLFEGARGRGEARIALGVERLPVLDVTWRGEVPAACFGRLERAVQERTFAGVRLTVGDATRPATVGDPTPWMAGADGLPLRLSAGGFGQATERMNATLARYVQRAVGALRESRAVELYAGAGNLSVLLARAIQGLVVVEADREACEAARANLAARALEARVVEGDAADYVWATTTGLVVLDPPRTGALKVAERLIESRVAHVVYVSCDPQTLGRDLGHLAQAYEPRAVATFEMFPQTSHVETVVLLERRRRGKGPSEPVDLKASP